MSIHDDFIFSREDGSLGIEHLSISVTWLEKNSFLLWCSFLIPVEHFWGLTFLTGAFSSERRAQKSDRLLGSDEIRTRDCRVRVLCAMPPPPFHFQLNINNRAKGLLMSMSSLVRYLAIVLLDWFWALQLTMREAESEQLEPVAPVQLVVVEATTRQWSSSSPLPSDLWWPDRHSPKLSSQFMLNSQRNSIRNLGIFVPSAHLSKLGWFRLELVHDSFPFCL